MLQTGRRPCYEGHLDLSGRFVFSPGEGSPPSTSSGVALALPARAALLEL